jgi:hypothetical protein
MSSKHIKALLNNITAEMISNHLCFNGWKLDEHFPNKKLMVFDKFFTELSDSFKIVIPSNEKYSDFKVKLFDVLNTLCDLENKSFNDLVTEVSKQDVDLFEFRITANCAKEGTLPLHLATDFVKTIKELIISSANSEELPRPYHRKPTSTAMAFGDLFRFGQTDLGSYILTIETNSLKDSPTQFIITESGETKEQSPIQRRIISRIQKALYQIESYGPHTNFEKFLKDAYIEGVNANMCNAILELEKHTDCPISFESKIKFSKLYPAPKDIPEKVKFSYDNFMLVQSIYEAYREHEQKEPCHIIGKVTKIATSGSSEKPYYDTEVKGDVTISFKLRGKYRSVKIYMENIDYKTACDALKEKRIVGIKGIIDKTNRTWTLENPKNFHILTKKELE